MLIKQLCAFLAFLIFIMLLVFNQRYWFSAEKQEEQIHSIFKILDYQGRERYKVSLLLAKFNGLAEDSRLKLLDEIKRELNQAKQHHIFSNTHLVDIEMFGKQNYGSLIYNDIKFQQARVSGLKKDYLDADFDSMNSIEIHSFTTNWLRNFINEVNSLQEVNQLFAAQLISQYLSPSLHKFIWINSLGIFTIVLLSLFVIYSNYQNQVKTNKEITQKLQSQNTDLKYTQVILESQTEDLLAERSIQRKLLSQLKDAQNRAFLINQFLPIGLILVGSDGRIVEANREATQLLQYSETELLTMKVEQLVPEALRAHHEKMRNDFKKEKAPRKMAASAEGLVGMRKDGSTIALDIGLAPIKLEGKSYVLATLVDVSERRSALLQLEIKNSQMDAALEKLRQSNAQLERFAFVCSHDLQEPLRMVASFSQLLERSAGNVLDVKSKGYLKHLIDGSLQAQELVSDILSYCRIDQSHNHEPYQDINLHDVITKVRHTLDATIKEKNANLVFSDDLPVITGVPSQLFQLFMNLISNGLKFNLSNVPIVNISATKSSNGWNIKVSDNGIGIEKIHMSKMFQIFNRLNQKSEFPGTGIGLAICKRIVAQHGGTIHIESIVGKGSDFIIDWPNHYQVEN